MLNLFGLILFIYHSWQSKFNHYMSQNTLQISHCLDRVYVFLSGPHSFFQTLLYLMSTALFQGSSEYIFAGKAHLIMLRTVPTNKKVFLCGL